MDTRETLIKISVDTYKGNKAVFSHAKDPNELIREKLIEANGGSADFSLKYRKAHPVEEAKVFALMEDLIAANLKAGLSESSPLFKYVDYKNGKDGDAPSFKIKSNDILDVSVIARGSTNVRRQRLTGGGTKTLIPEAHTVKLYEEAPLIMAGKIDFADFIDRVSEGYAHDMSAEVCDAFVNATDTAHIISVTGTYDEDKLVQLISEVEMKNQGKTAIILGTKVALRKIKIDNAGESAKDDWYALGYYGKFAGTTECIELKNAYKADGVTTVLPDDRIFVIASDDKFIKHYTEGEVLVVEKQIGDNADLTQDYLAISNYVTGVVLADTMGNYIFS